MIIFKTPIVLLMLALLIGLHIASLLVKEKLGKILTFVNIGLHILLLPLLLIQKFTIEDGVLCYMISIFAYTLASYIVYKVRGGEGTHTTETPSTANSFHRKRSPSPKEEALDREGTEALDTEGCPPSPEEKADETPADTPTTAETSSPEEKADETPEGGADK